MCCNRELFTDDDGFLHRQRSLALDVWLKYNCEDAWNAASGWFRIDRCESLTARLSPIGDAAKLKGGLRSNYLSVIDKQKVSCKSVPIG